MKIITWNCKMKFREEYKLIFPMNPDIIIVQECEDLRNIHFDLFSNIPSDLYWIGSNPSKGLGVITFNNYKISLYNGYDDSFKYILPLLITKKSISYNLIGVWTQLVGKGTKDHINYIRQFKLSMKTYDSFIKTNNTIIIGDFNSNLIWEKPKKHIDYDHKYVVEELQKKDIESSYHYFFKEKQGEETKPTFYYHHKEEKTFHIDFCFLSKNLTKKINSVEIGKYHDWIKYSDHVPMIITLDHFDS